MKRSRTVASIFLLISIQIVALTQSTDTSSSWSPEIKLVSALTLPGSFVTPQAIYADAERIFAGSYQGDLFILERDRRANFPLIQTLHLPSSVTAVQGDEDNLYVANRDGRLYHFSKTWPVQFVGSMALSSYGLLSVQVAGNKIYVGKGQASMTASNDRLYISALNEGDSGLEVPDMRGFGETYESGTTVIYDRSSLQAIGRIPNPGRRTVNVTASRDFIYLTDFGWGIHVYDAATLNKLEYLPRSTNTVAVARRRGLSLLLGGSESGAVDLYVLGKDGYQLVNSAYLPAITGFQGLEDIEIRGLWFDGLDNLVFAGSSWGNDRSRGPHLPSLFVLEVDRKLLEIQWRPGTIRSTARQNR